MLNKNQRGITLVEVLAIIVLISIIGLLMWNIFFQGVNYSANAITKTQIQQQANVIISDLTKIHQTTEEDYYEIIPSADSCSFSIIDRKNLNRKYENSKLCLQVENTPITIKPKNEDNNKLLKLTIFEKNNRDNQIQVEFQLHRLIGGE
ncbi:prepilin-type N-terminal cleavage/methylation domain-containing protein [Ureibacillus composti]|nr:prepilin-type N-terminal cleavage/methylation domain-containing protein [Ureibacillus composti]